MVVSAKNPTQNICGVCGKPLTKGDVGDTCRAHEGKIRSQAKESAEVPQGFLKMSDVCRKANEAGITTSALVTAAGGDAATKPVLDPVFEVVYVGKRKYMDPRVLIDGFALLKRYQSEVAQAKEKPVGPQVIEANTTKQAVLDAFKK